MALASEASNAALRRSWCPSWPEGCLRPAIGLASLTLDARNAHALKASTGATYQRVSLSSVLGSKPVDAEAGSRLESVPVVWLIPSAENCSCCCSTIEALEATSGSDAGERYKHEACS